MRNSRELVLQSLRHEPPDRTPVIPLAGLFTTSVSGIPVNKLLRDPDAQTRSQLASLRQFGYDGVVTIMDLTAEAEALGATVKYQENAFPYITKHPYPVPADFPDLELPDIRKTRLSVFVETTRSLVKQVGKTHFVGSYVIGPFTLAGQLMGVEPLFELITDDPDRALSIVNNCEEVLEPYVERLVEAGTHSVIILEPTASSSVVPPDFFVRYSVPNVKRLISLSKAQGAGSTLHICGNTTKIIGLMCDTGADALSLDSKISIEEAMKIVNQRCTIIGNVDTTLMLTGTVDEIVTATKKCIQAAGPSGAGFIASTGCDLPIEAPFDNVRALVDTAKGHKPGKRSL